MNKYMLITVWDRNIATLLFPTKKDAQKAMQEEMIKYGNIPKEAFTITDDTNEDWAFTEDSGWSNIGVNHTLYDWLIVPIPNSNQKPSYTAFIYENDGITTHDMSQYNNKEEAIQFAKTRKWDEVVDDNTGEIVWHK